MEKQKISEEVSGMRFEIRKMEIELQNAQRKLDDANDDIIAKQGRLERLEGELGDQRRECKLLELDRERKANEVKNLQDRIDELEREIQSLQDDLILSHRAYEQCKRQLEDFELSDDQTETSTLRVDVTERPQQTTTLDIDVKPQVTTLDINVAPQRAFEYSFTPQTEESYVTPQTTTEYSSAPPTSRTQFDARPQRTSEYSFTPQTTTTELEITTQTTTLDINVQERHETTELEIDIEQETKNAPNASWSTGRASSFQVYRDRKYGPVEFALEEEEDGGYEIAQIESRREPRRRWKY